MNTRKLSDLSPEEIRRQAEQGNTEAMRLLGAMYAFGMRIEQDDSQAIHWYSEAARQGDLPSQCFLASRYTYGMGVEKDRDQAFSYFKEAAGQGHPWAQHELARIHMEEPAYYNPQEASRLLKAAAEQGNPASQNALGELREQADDSRQAVYWWQQSATSGNPDAQYHLGRAFQSGAGVHQDTAKAVYWYWKAVAGGGHPLAEYELGLMYYHGEGIEPDHQQALELLRRSAAQDIPEAQYLVGLFYTEQVPDTPVDLDEARMWLQRAADRGDREAREELAKL